MQSIADPTATDEIKADSRSGRLPGRWRKRRWLRWLPNSWRQKMRRLYYGWQICRGRFGSDEADFRMLSRLVRGGDTVLDVGANVGRYTLKLSELVGPAGRVFAFEPVAETFEILAANARRARHENITLLNVGVSSHSHTAPLVVPTEQAGFAAHYFAHVGEDREGTRRRGDAGTRGGGGRVGSERSGACEVSDGETEGWREREKEACAETGFLSLSPALPLSISTGPRVFCCSIDSLGIPERVSLVKIDVEGHEVRVLEGMRETIGRDRPTLIVEGEEAAIDAMLDEFGYEGRPIEGSRNRLFVHAAMPEAVEALC